MSTQQLYFHHNDHGTLQAMSKSDNQKLRVRDLSCKQERIIQQQGSNNDNDTVNRRKRPEYVGITSM